MPVKMIRHAKQKEGIICRVFRNYWKTLKRRPSKTSYSTPHINEVDDQFALAYAMLSPERIRLLSVNAAPFSIKIESPSDGMEKSTAKSFIMKLVDPSKIPATGARAFSQLQRRAGGVGGGG